MMLTFLKNLKSQNNQSKKKKRQKLLKMQLYFLMEGKTFSIPLKVEYFQKKKTRKRIYKYFILRSFRRSQVRYLIVRSLTVGSSKY